MCVSSSKAEFSATKGYIGEAQTKHGLVHVMGYQNKAQNESFGPNSMILHFPASELMGKGNVIDVGEKGKNVLNLMCSTFMPKSRGLTKGLALSNSFKVEIFDSGIYTIVMSNKPTLINKALESVPENKRPKISLELMKWYEELYPGFQVAVCCFDNQDAIESAPLFWWYKPINEKELFFPAIDCHTGLIPDLKSDVYVDHILTCSVLSLNEKNSEPAYKSILPDDVKEFFPNAIAGRHYEQYTKLKNGDFVIQKTEVSKFNSEFSRMNFNPQSIKPILFNFKIKEEDFMEIAKHSIFNQIDRLARWNRDYASYYNRGSV